MASRTALETYFNNIRFLRKTVFVKDNDVTSAFAALNKILRNDKVINVIKAQEYYEKPTRMRRRVMYERCKRIYDAEMSRKINFVMKVDRPDPWLR
ncbi:Mitochondrial 28S ribosomal protein S21 [Echinococcus multilocularis]|uniref:Mitochondrial 28S ribosomal protein S21 n=1 Tax=Echinococcus multilocularis TaxID=6211 RepID=A0A068YDR1_ECHMU|nr:Mitochondrial 28S ribosomal protein S21 [Echinococcus multilocularis]